MGFEVVADDNDVGASLVGPVHLLGCTDTATHDEGQADRSTYGTYDLFRHRMQGTATGLEIDELLSHQLGCDRGIDYRLKVGRREGLGTRYSHRGRLNASVDEDVGRRNTIHAGVADATCRPDLLTNNILRVVSGQEREEEHRIRLGAKLRRISRK